MKNRYKVVTIVGTRPEVIRLAAILKQLDEFFNHKLIHTGQNYTKTLSSDFFGELGIREPDFQIKLPNVTFGTNLGEMFIEVERYLADFKPHAVLILGDTNSSLTSIVAKNLKIPVYHIEAGNRSFDLNVPEEINRKIVDHIADFNLVYSEHARRNLLAEGINSRDICLVGSPLFEVITNYRDKIEKSNILESLEISSKKYFLLSMHRQENIDSDGRLEALVKMINELVEVYKLPVILSAHPRTLDKLDQLDLKLNNNVIKVEPFGFLDYCKLQLHALVTISDSGSISEESAILGTKAITIRDSMERPEALEASTINMAGINTGSILGAIEYVLSDKFIKESPAEYQIKNTSSRVVNFMLSTIGTHKFWHGLR